MVSALFKPKTFTSLLLPVGIFQSASQWVTHLPQLILAVHIISYFVLKKRLMPPLFKYIMSFIIYKTFSDIYVFSYYFYIHNAVKLAYPAVNGVQGQHTKGQVNHRLDFGHPSRSFNFSLLMFYNSFTIILVQLVASHHACVRHYF